MIERMKKLTFLVYHNDYQGFLEHLRELGVVHVVERQTADSDQPALTDKIRQLERMRSVASAFDGIVAGVPEGAAIPETKVADAAEAVQTYDSLVQKQTEIEQQVSALDKLCQQTEPWGDFNPESVKRLEDAGYVMQFFSCPERSWNEEWTSQYNAMVINTEGGRRLFVTLMHKGQEAAPDADVVPMPTMSLSAMRQRIAELESEAERVKAETMGLAVSSASIMKDACRELQQNVEFSKVELNTEGVADGKVCQLEGWAPASTIPALQEYLDTVSCIYQVDMPTPEDDVPIKLRNGRFARLFEPLTGMYSLPSYGELDPTAAFAPFFTLFFGLCLGDGGYGLLVLLACTFAKKKFPALKDYMTLGQWLGASTILVGLLTGMVFGISLDSVPWPWLAGVKDKFITDNNYSVMGYSPMMVFAICVGVLQILFAMGFKIVRTTIQYGVKYALSDMGWLVLLVDMIVLLCLKLSGTDIAQTAMYVILGIAGVCAVLILFFNSPGKNPFANLGSGLWGTYNMVSGLLGDVLSYIRLFALGLAGGILGGVFNSLAFQAGGGLPAWIGWLPTAFILVFGHGLNLFLCVISSVVHPLRLTYVEFFKNAGFDGGGKAYRPFSKK
ncbi:MAG: V-type ATP synthase subunit I [Bacteroidaceae bacterium]|nr:V-type ATP synthase subunit I [Bacteroidaceae bacterium]